MEEEKLEIGAGTPPADEGKTPEPSKVEKSERTEKEKAEYTLKSVAKKVRELGGDPDKVLERPPLKVDEHLSDDTPLTVGTLREFQKQEAHKTSLQLVDDLPEDERDDVREILTNRIKPSGNAEADLVLARAAANAKRTTQIAETMRKSQVTRTASGGSAPVKGEARPAELTEAELVFTRPPYNLKPEKIIAARPQN